MFRGLEPRDHTTYLDTRLELGCHSALLNQRPNSIMTCEQLARKLAALNPQATPIEIARQCLLILNTQPDLNLLADEDQLKLAIRAANFRLDAAADSIPPWRLNWNSCVKTVPFASQPIRFGSC